MKLPDYHYNILYFTNSACNIPSFLLPTAVSCQFIYLSHSCFLPLVGHLRRDLNTSLPFWTASLQSSLNHSYLLLRQGSSTLLAASSTLFFISSHVSSTSNCCHLSLSFALINELSCFQISLSLSFPISNTETELLSSA